MIPLAILALQLLRQNLQRVGLGVGQIGEPALGIHGEQEHRDIVARVERDNPIAAALALPFRRETELFGNRRNP